MNCLGTWRIAGPCSGCGAYQGNGVHLVGEKIYGACCCPVHAVQATMEWVGEPVTVEGEQRGLWD